DRMDQRNTSGREARYPDIVTSINREIQDINTRRGVFTKWSRVENAASLNIDLRHKSPAGRGLNGIRRSCNRLRVSRNMGVAGAVHSHTEKRGRTVVGNWRKND